MDLTALDALDLPVEAAISEVAAALDERGLAVLQAEPGAGKTTVVPLRLLDAPWLQGRRIVVLEPRRVAARAAARRMSDLIDRSVGETVGVRTRDDTRVSASTQIEVVTEGVLTRRLQHEPSLDDVGLVVFDEFHERSLVADLGLALALEARGALRPDLRILVMSATIDADRVAGLLGGDDGPAPAVHTPGRVHPVTVGWRPRGVRDPLEPAVAAAVREVVETEPGDVLVFLPGAAAINRTARLLSGLEDPNGGPVAVRPLFGALKAAEQDRALAPDPTGRKVVLATDIAETSLTVEGVRSVVDSGVARSPQYDPGTGMTRLVTVSISQASAEQRAGRAGRTAPGRVLRLWSEAEHGGRRRQTDPEITRVDLAGFVLEAAVWGERQPSSLALLDAPPEPAVNEARELLGELGALDDDGAPTAHGRALADLPLHPRLANLLVRAVEQGDGWTGCLIAAVLEERDVLGGRPDDKPADIGVRLHLVDDPGRDHPRADRGGRQRVRQRAKDLSRRLRVRPDRIADDRVGLLLAAAYPDRIGQRRGEGRGRFRLRSGAGAWVGESDVLAGEELVVVADTDGARRDARIFMGAGLDVEDFRSVFGDRIEPVRTVAWSDERNDLLATVEHRLGALRFDRHVERADAGEATTAALVERVRTTELAVLPWKPASRLLQARAEFVRTHLGDDTWPALDDDTLSADLEAWLAPMLVGARGRADLDRLDLLTTLRTRLGWDRVRRLDQLVPERVDLPSGRAAAVDYSQGRPVVRAKVQELYGIDRHPTILDGRVPVVFELTSPADRPVQVTDDLIGFWSGSWLEVRKDMAGRYPKHDWPEDPATAQPSGPGGRRRR